MLKRFVSALITTAMVLCSGYAVAGPSAAAVEDLACKAGLCQQIDAMRQQMLDSLDDVAGSASPGIDGEVMKRLRRVADHAYSAERLRAILFRELTERLDEKDIPALQDWFNSPVGVVIAKAEQASVDLDPQAPMTRGMDILSNSSQDRKKLLADILRESHTAESSVDIIINTTLAVRNGVMTASPDVPHPDTRELEATLRGKRPAMIKSFAQVSLPILASSYASVSDADLSAYLNFMQTAEGARFNEVSIRSFERALLIAAAEFGQAIPGTRKGLNV